MQPPPRITLCCSNVLCQHNQSLKNVNTIYFRNWNISQKYIFLQYSHFGSLFSNVSDEFFIEHFEWGVSFIETYECICPTSLPHIPPLVCSRFCLDNHSERYCFSCGFHYCKIQDNSVFQIIKIKNNYKKVVNFQK